METGNNHSQENPEPSVRKTPTPSDGTDVGSAEMPESREQFVEQALAEYETLLVGYAMGFLHDLDRARDVVQDTFIRLCRQDIEKVREGLKGWLFTVCRNRALDVLRKESRIGTLEEAGPMESDEVRPDRTADFGERIEQVYAYLDRLPENQKTVILMKFRDGMSYKEISAATGLSGGNVGYLIHTGLKRMKQLLPPDLMEGGPR